MDTDFTAVPDWFPADNAGAGIAVADIDGDGRPDLVVLMVDDPPGQNAGYFRIGWGTDDQATVGGWTEWTAVPDWAPWFNEGAGVAVADVSGSGRPDLIVFMVDGPPGGANAGYYRIGWDLDTAGRVSGWSPWMAVPDWFPWANAGADIAVADVYPCRLGAVTAASADGATLPVTGADVRLPPGSVAAEITYRA